MSSVWTIARKELRATFLSPVAHIFLALFWAALFVNFFTVERFFAQGLASLQALFSALPLMLILLVPALTMRQWSDEQRTGTFEVLVTLPVRTRDLVLGKFLGTMLLVGGALLGTLTLPFMVASLGNLDWGTVFAGYLASLLVAAAYAAIGLCLSAVTDNQLVALMLSIVVCGLLYLIGSDAVAGLMSADLAEVARAIGTGSRFHYIERGLVSLRDIVYFGSLAAFFLVLNVHYVERKRADRASAEGRSRGRARLVTMALVGANALAANVWLTPMTSLRMDLTTSGRFGLADSTRNIVKQLEEPLTISAYISQETHPLLAPLVPQVKDALREYELAGDGRVKVEVVDPATNEPLQEEINQQYGVKTVPFRIQSRMEDKVVNSYFHLVVKYGDEYEVLGFDELIEVHATESDVDVRLKNLEYDLTRAIKKVSQGFQSLESAFAGMSPDVKVTLTAYVTKGTLPDEFKEIPERVSKVAKELAEKSGGHFVYDEKDPDAEAGLKEELARKYGFKPMAADLFGEQTFYMHLLVQSGDRLERIFPREGLSEADIKSTIEAAIKRATPGFLKTVGLMTAKPENNFNPQLPPQFQQPQKPPKYRAIEQMFSAEYTFKRVEGEDGYIPDDVDVLIVAQPGKLTDKQQFALDQYLMKGGKVVALAGAYAIDVDREGLKAEKADASLLDLLKNYGVEVDDAFVMDPQNARFPVPVREQRGMFVLERIELMPYPFFPDIRQEGFKEGHMALAGVPSIAMTWASPLKVTAKEGVTSETLLQTSKETWLNESADLQPDFQKFPQGGFGAPADAPRAAQPVAVTLGGTFTSAFANKPSPVFEKAAAAQAGDKKGDATGRTLKESLPDARLVVVGSSEFASDLVAQLGQQMGGGAYRGNMVLVRNLVDWAMEDTDLLQIRSAGAFAWTLRTPSADEWSYGTWEKTIYGVAFGIWAALVAMALTRRRRVAPLPIATEEARAA